MMIGQHRLHRRYLKRDVSSLSLCCALDPKRRTLTLSNAVHSVHPLLSWKIKNLSISTIGEMSSLKMLRI